MAFLGLRSIRSERESRDTPMYYEQGNEETQLVTAVASLFNGFGTTSLGVRDDNKGDTTGNVIRDKDTFCDTYLHFIFHDYSAILLDFVHRSSLVDTQRSGVR